MVLSHAELYPTTGGCLMSGRKHLADSSHERFQRWDLILYFVIGFHHGLRHAVTAELYEAMRLPFSICIRIQTHRCTCTFVAFTTHINLLFTVHSIFNDSMFSVKTNLHVFIPTPNTMRCQSSCQMTCPSSSQSWTISSLALRWVSPEG